MPAMRVAYLVNQYPGLSHSFVRREVQALERRGVHVDRYAIRPVGQGQLSAEDEAEAARTRTLLSSGKGELLAGVLRAVLHRPGGAARTLGTALSLSRRSSAGTLRHLFYWAEAQLIAGWVRDDGAEHVHAHFGTNSATIGMLAADIAGVPFSQTVHGPEEFDGPRGIGLPTKIERAAFTAGVSSYGVSQLRRLVDPSHWDRIAQIHCGIEPAFYEGAAADAECKSADFVCVGRLCEQKGQLTLIEAAGRLRAAGRAFTMELLGDGDMRPEIEAAIARLDLGEHVRLLGWQSPTEVRAALERARCFVLPSFAEGLPVSIMEAYTLGLPVISTYIAGIPELVRDGENGWLVPAADAGALAEAMTAALDASDAERDRMGQAGRARTLERHDIDDQARRLEELFAAARA